VAFPSTSSLILRHEIGLAGLELSGGVRILEVIRSRGRTQEKRDGPQVLRIERGGDLA